MLIFFVLIFFFFLDFASVVQPDKEERPLTFDEQAPCLFCFFVSFFSRCFQVSDLVIILNQRRAIEAFTKGGNLTLGGNATVAVGPLGR